MSEQVNHEDKVIVSTGGHDTLWFNFVPTNLPLPQLFQEALKRWPKDRKPPIAMIVLRQHNPKYCNVGDSFCGYDRREGDNCIKYYKEAGLTYVST